jgi:tripartite-type tricarboxylate transporter receptor subunit TctC
MNFPRRQFLHLAAGAAALSITSLGAGAQNTYPARSITVIVPAPAGGPTDILARIMAERMRVSLGQSIIIENITGANGTIGVGRAARASSDGYTIEMGLWSTHVIPGAIYNLAYDAVRDFEPIAALATNPMVLYARKTMPATTLAELITWLKANPEKASQGTTTLGTHAVGALFQRETGTRFQFVPYRGSAPAIQDLLAGQIDMVLDASFSLPHVKAGNIKAYFIVAKTRSTIDPDIPTAEEVGLPALSSSPWWALFAPKGTSRSVVEKLNAAAVEALADPAVRQRIVDNGFGVFPRDQQPPEALGALVRADKEKWWPIVKAANIKGE